MKKIITTTLLPVLSIAMAILAFGSCKKSDIKSLKEMKQDERKAIESFISRMGFTIKDGAEGQTEFDPNVMYHFDNDLYMQVLDKGKEAPELNKTKINVRMEGFYFNRERDSIVVFNSLTSGGFQESVFRYIHTYNDGDINFELIPCTTGANLDAYVCQGIAFPMTMLGNGARVRLIVPFRLGPDNLYSQGMTGYYKEVEYIFRK